MRPAGVVVIGAGQAGVQFAVSLRETNSSTPITLIGAEAGNPYQRPQLSKEFITNAEETEPLMLRTLGALAERKIDFRDAREVISIDPKLQTVRLNDGTEISYSQLVLATGSRNRSLPVPGAELAGVYTLRTLDQAFAIRKALTNGHRVVIVGAGFIGMEIAAAARIRGFDATVIDIAERPMARMLSEPMSRFFLGAHGRDGITFRLGQGIQSFEGKANQVNAVITTEGERLPADLVIVAVGIQPNVELAASAGVEVDNGIVVDSRLRTNVPQIWALGDCASFPHPLANTHVRLESVQNAADQAKYLGHNLSNEAAPAYGELPWFWSFQGELKLRIAGLIAAPDQIVLRGEPESRKFSVFCFADGHLQSVESVNATSDHMAARRILAAERQPSLSASEIADPGFDLKKYSQRL